jgi:hypothetical protein
MPSSTFLPRTKRKPSAIVRSAWALGVVGRRQRREPPDRPERGREGGRVEQVRALEPEDGDQQTAERRPRDVGGAAVDVLDRDRGGQLVLVDEARDGAVHPSDAEREDRHRERNQHVDRPHARLVERGVEG